MELWLLVLALAILIGFFIIGFIIRKALKLAINSAIGLGALYAISYFVLPNLLINLWSVLLVAIFGIFGLIFVIIMHLFGVWF